MEVIKLRKNEPRVLGQVMRSQSGQAALTGRARMILMSAGGMGFNHIRQRLGVTCELSNVGVITAPPIAWLA